MLVVDSFIQDFHFPNYVPVEYIVKWATHDWEKKQAYQIRRDVFCQEQGIFSVSDHDEIDDRAQLLVAVTCIAPGLWYGSRLAVHQDYRGQGKLGATLIKLAVSSANAIGCHSFLAHVQSQNVPLFRRLHWTVIEQEILLDRSHHLMRANLDKYPPCITPQTGFVIQSKATT
jgi:hypothetical protein